MNFLHVNLTKQLNRNGRFLQQHLQTAKTQCDVDIFALRGQIDF